MKEKTLGQQIKERRKALGLTLEACRELAGIAERTLINVEEGISSPSPTVRKALCEVLKISIREIVEPIK